MRFPSESKIQNASVVYPSCSPAYSLSLTQRRKMFTEGKLLKSTDAAKIHPDDPTSRKYLLSFFYTNAKGLDSAL